MTKYSEYKDNSFNENWNMFIPNGWKEVALRRYCKISSGSTPKSEPEFWNGEIDWVTPDDLGKNNKKTISKTNRKITIEGYISCGTELISANSIILSTRAPIGHTAKITKEMCFNQGCKGLTPDEHVDSDFLYYLVIASKEKLKILGNGTTFIELSRTALASFKGIFPPIQEQILIAQFLDKKTSQIDKLIEQKEKLLKLLTEKRTAIITQAVTKGLDLTVEMKDSGIDWLGEIPKHWVPKKLKFLSEKIIDGTHSTPEYISDGIPFLRVTDIVKSNNGELDFDNFKYISEAEHLELTKRCMPEFGDLLYSKNGTIGVSRVVDWDFDFSIFVSLCLIKIKKELIIPSFLDYSLQSKLTENQISIGSKKSAVINLHLEKIKEFVIPYPPLKEQTKINDWLNQQLPKLKMTEGKLSESIVKLKEYREALITSAVTGQIDLRKEVHHEYAYRNAF